MVNEAVGYLLMRAVNCGIQVQIRLLPESTVSGVKYSKTNVFHKT